MPTCYVIPGFLSSELAHTGFLKEVLWVNYSAIMLGYIGGLRLDSNGIDPGSPDGSAMEVTQLLPALWATPLKLLEFQLYKSGYNMRPLPWDWRKEIVAAGQVMAATIRGEVDPADPCTIVAHSAGGLVARAIWSALLGTGDEGLVRRIVTLGTPHQGTYAPVQSLSDLTDWMQQLARQNLLGSGIRWVERTEDAYIRWTLGDYHALLATWPALYELFPTLGGSEAAKDPDRVKVFQKDQWQEAPYLYQPWLNYARFSFGAWLNSAASMPPAWVLTTVAGDDAATYDRLENVKLLGTLAALHAADDGDGVVTTGSALVPASARHTLTCQHTDLPLATIRSGDLMEWILDVRGPSTPTPPPDLVPGVVPPGIESPPFCLPIGGRPGPGNCGGGVCNC